MGGARRLCTLLTVLLVAVGCGGGQDQAGEPDCPTTSPGQPAATTAVDPRCVERATEREGDGDQAADRVWQGTSHSTYSGAPPIDSRITVIGRRDDGSFRLTLAHDPGTRIDVVAPITGATAANDIDLTGEMGTYSRGSVRLECRDCGDLGG